MKRLLLFSILSIFCLTISAQTKTWIGPSGGFFNQSANWNPAGVPGSTNDVIIPTGSDMIINDAPSIKSFELQGNAIVTMTYHLTFTNASSIATNATLNWTTGTLFGSGTLTNNGTINLNDGGTVIANSVTLINNGSYNVNFSGIHFIGYGSPIFINSFSGIINLNAESGSIQAASGQGTITNTGLIRRAQGAGVYGINIPLLNNNGTISVETGTLQIQNALTEFNGGTYNVNSGKLLEWNSTFTCTGTLTGQLDGTLNWTGTLNVASGTEAILDFDTPQGINWNSGSFVGDGTLKNTGILNLESANAKSINGQSLFINESIFNINSSAVLYIAYGTPTLNNTASGVININSDGSIQAASGNGNIINTGIIKKDNNPGNFSIASNITNTLPGKFIVEAGLLRFYGTFEGDGILTGNGAVELGSNIFEGTLSPGGFPGTLTHVGNFTSTANAILAIEIYGPDPGTDYDVFEVQGNAVLDGDILLYLAYEANLNDEFVILTANNITGCNLPATVTVVHNFHGYNFDVICNPDNVTLKITDIFLGTEENSLSNLSMYPNPSNGQFTIDLGREYTAVSVKIYNMLGQQISSSTYTSAKIIEQEINTSAGMYFVKVATKEGGSETLKLIKN